MPGADSIPYGAAVCGWWVETCSTRFALHQQQHPRPFGEAFTSASDEAVVHEALLRAIAKQESRYSPGVQSPVGAQGLMQLMPATAAEVAGHPSAQQKSPTLTPTPNWEPSISSSC